jgi:hypothetical protein
MRVTSLNTLSQRHNLSAGALTPALRNFGRSAHSFRNASGGCSSTSDVQMTGPEGAGRRFEVKLEDTDPDIPILIAAKSECAKLQWAISIPDIGS